MYPHFLGIGAQKAGSTWIDRNLECHPDIWMPPRKEIHYFDRPPDFRDPPNKKNRSQQEATFKSLSVQGISEMLWLRKFKRIPRSDAWYSSLFTPDKGQICGEVTPDYSALDEGSVARVHALLPDAKIIYIMRNPIERTWSHALMDFKRARRNAENSSVDDLEEFARRDYVQRRSDYLKTLSLWSSLYPKENIFVGFMEDIESDPRSFLRSLYGFLGVNTSFKSPTPKRRVNVRSTGSMPTGVARMLAGLYREELALLADSFGGHAASWSYYAERLLSDPPQEERTTVPMSKFHSRKGSDEIMDGNPPLGTGRHMQSAPLSAFSTQSPLDGGYPHSSR